MPKKTAAPKKPAAKKAETTTAKKAIEKKKLDAVPPKKAATKAVPAKKTAAKGAAKGDKKFLELGLLLDCTSSMGSWIERAKTTLIEIMNNVKASCDGQLDIRVAFVGYRDHCDRDRFTIKPFTENLEEVRQFISTTVATGGGDIPEDVVGGLRKCLDLDWQANSKKQVFLICDAPCHGRKYHDMAGGGMFCGDNYPDGSPEGLVLEDLMKEFGTKKIEFTMIKLNETTNKMIQVMKESYSGLQVTDLAAASKNKSAAEVTKMFVESASYILRATVGATGGKGAKSAAAKRKAAASSKPLWDIKKLEVGNNFSCISYLHVDAVDGDRITVKNQLGGAWFISKDLLARDAWSADHFEKTVICNQTELAQILDACGDTIFSVTFKKKIDAKQIEEKLTSASFKDLKDDKKMKALSKDLVEGQQTTIIGHLIDVDNNLGRSVIVDLSVPAPNNVRQVDHRTIESITLRNVQYSFGRKKESHDELPLKPEKDAARWDVSKLAVGNWFSQVQYFKVKSIDKDTVQAVSSKDSSAELQLDKDILVTEMHSAQAFDTEEKVTRTEIVDHMMNAKDSCFTVTFCKKVDDKWVTKVLGESITSEKQFKDAKLLKETAKQLAAGEEVTMVCQLRSGATDANMGRSPVLDLNGKPGMNFRQVDHRTISSLTLKNVKYTIKK